MGLRDQWYKNAIIYCLDVETYADSDGDGVGDFRGLTARLDYLAGLGVTCLWLMPFYPTPNRDDGYDISDYCNVDPRYGTMADFAEFMRRGAGARPPRHRRPGPQPHLGRASLVPGGAARPPLHVPRLLRLARRRPGDTSDEVVLPRRSRRHLDLRRAGEGLVPAPLLRLPARPELREPRGARGDSQDHGALAAAGVDGLSGRCRAVPDRAERRRRRARAAAGARVPAGDAEFAAVRSGNASCSAR